MASSEPGRRSPGKVRRGASDLLSELRDTPPGARGRKRAPASPAASSPRAHAGPDSPGAFARESPRSARERRDPGFTPHFRKVPPAARPWAEGVDAAIDARVAELRRRTRVERVADAAALRAEAGSPRALPRSPVVAAGAERHRSGPDRVHAARELSLIHI